VIRVTRIEELPEVIAHGWDLRDDSDSLEFENLASAVDTTLDLLDRGVIRVAEKIDGEWCTNQWMKMAILLSFRINDSALVSGGPGGSSWYDKVPSKFNGMSTDDFKIGNVRAVPGAIVRRSAFLDRGVIVMPSFVNVGARVGRNTMIDTWATVGSCAQIGNNVHLSGGVGIGGVLEPLQASPTIIEDNCFIGARSEVVEGVVVSEGSVLGMGVFVSASTKIVNRDTGEIHVGFVPPYSVVVPGTFPGRPLPDGSPGPNLGCAVIVKTVDARTRSKTGINELLRT
jgi:2,3,4,5-tetrahydropyridine-2,6-dicarboxylate N-succinyltransferase